MKTKKILFALFAGLFALSLFANGGESVEPYPNFGLPRVEEMMFLVLQIGIILFAAKIGGSIATLLKMPSILGELGAGILIGPWALGGIGFCPDMFGGLFKDGLFHGAALRAFQAKGHMYDATSPALYGIATLASIILLFLSGLETNLKLFLKYSFVGSMVGLGGVIFSFFLGDWCAVQFLPMFFPNVEWIQALKTMPLSQAMMQAGPLYMGIMSTATSVGITARILSERKKMDSEEGVTIMAGAVIDDVLGLIVLAIGNGIIAANEAAKASGATAQGVNWGEIGMVAVKAFGVWLGGTIIGVVCARKISWLLKLVKDPKVIGTLAFGLSMILAGFFESMGLAMIIGAYVMGLSLSRTDLKHLIQENLEPVYTFLVPIFFCVMGMMVDVSALCSKPVLYFGAVYTALAVAAKVVGCALPSLFCGFNLLGGLRIGAGMVPRGEVALIIAGLGLSKGYLSPEIFGIGILMTLITTVIAPPCLVGLFIPKAAGIRHRRPSNEGSRTVTFKMPSNAIAEMLMERLVRQFRQEGFFTHLLNPEENIWHVSMDTMEISMQRKDSNITVECTAEEENIVRQAWMEVVSQLNELLLAIRKPLGQDELKKTIADEKDLAQAAATSNVFRCLQHFVMVPDFKADSKKEAFEKLTQMIAEANPSNVKNLDEMRKAVFDREASMPTGLDHGIAVPHGRTDAVNSIIGAVALVDNSKNENGSIPDYETIDHSAIQIIIMTIAPESAQSPYLQLMAFLSRTVRAENGYERLLACKTSDEMRKFFKSSR